MGDYYNKTRTPIGIALRRGGSMSVGPKSWCYISPEDEGTPALADSVRKGFLVRALVPKTDLSPAASPTVSVSASPEALVASAPITTPIPESAASAASTLSPAPSAPPATDYKQSRRNK